MTIQLPELYLKTEKQWAAQRRVWKRTAEDVLYGTAPERVPVSSRVLSSEPIFGGRALEERVRITYGPGASFDARVFRPLGAGPHPAVVWVWFKGDPGEGCPLEDIVAGRGYVLAGYDREELFEDSVQGASALRDCFPGYTFGAIRAWAMGLSMLADALTDLGYADPARLVCTGFSRCGKAALCAGIYDERFRVTVPVCSGAGGGGCFRYLGDRGGFHQDETKAETLGAIGSAFPHWWAPAFSAWQAENDPRKMGLEDVFPLDSHILKALIAPRNLLTIDGTEDDWSNPLGSALTFLRSREAFERLGGRSESMFHEGGHAFGTQDWGTLMDFCDEVFGTWCSGRSWVCALAGALREGTE